MCREVGAEGRKSIVDVAPKRTEERGLPLGGNNRQEAVPDIRYSAQTKGLYLQCAREARFLFSSLGLPFLRKKGLAKD